LSAHSQAASYGDSANFFIHSASGGSRCVSKLCDFKSLVIHGFGSGLPQRSRHGSGGFNSLGGSGCKTFTAHSSANVSSDHLKSFAGFSGSSSAQARQSHAMNRFETIATLLPHFRALLCSNAHFWC